MLHLYASCRRMRAALPKFARSPSYLSWRKSMSSRSKSSSWMQSCNGAGVHRSQTSARLVTFAELASPCSRWRITCSSQTSSRAASFAFSGACKSSFDRWPRLQKSLATSSSNKSSKKHPRCLSGRIPSSLPHRCISELAFYCNNILFISFGLTATYTTTDDCQGQARIETGNHSPGEKQYGNKNKSIPLGYQHAPSSVQTPAARQIFS